MILRCTAKALELLGHRPAAVQTLPAAGDADWYLNLVWIDRRKCLVLTHAATLYTVLAIDVRKADVTPIGPFVVDLVERTLRRQNLPLDILGALESASVEISRTADRSLLGSMNDIGFWLKQHAFAHAHVSHVDVDLLHRYLYERPGTRGGKWTSPAQEIERRLLLRAE